MRPALPLLLLGALALAGCGGGGKKPTTASGTHAKIRIRHDGRVFESGPARVVKIAVEKGPQGQTLALIPVTIDGHGPYPFALDTGAARSVIDASIVHRLGLKETGTAHRVTGVTGSEQATNVRVRDWRIGAVRLRPRTVTDIQLPNPGGGGGLRGLIGSDVLSSFGLVAIDYDHGRAFLEARSGS